MPLVADRAGPNLVRPALLARELNLTQNQITQLQQLRDDYLAATKATRDQLQAKCGQMVDLWAAAQPDANQIKALAADIDALRAELRDTGIDYMIRGLGVLTPEQRTKVQGLVKNMGARCLQGGCGACLGPGIGCGMGLGMGMGPGCGMGPGAGCPMGLRGGTGPGWGNGTGPRSQMGACPRVTK